MSFVTALAWFWVAMGIVGAGTSVFGIRHSLQKLRDVRRNGIGAGHPMMILSQSHLRHHVARMMAFLTGIAVAGLVLSELRFRVPGHTIAVLLTATMVVFTADSFLDVVLRFRLVRMYEEGEFSGVHDGDSNG